MKCAKAPLLDVIKKIRELFLYGRIEALDIAFLSLNSIWDMGETQISLSYFLILSLGASEALMLECQ